MEAIEFFILERQLLFRRRFILQGPQENRTFGHLGDPNIISCTITKPPQSPRQVSTIIIIVTTKAATSNHKDDFLALSEHVALHQNQS